MMHQSATGYLMTYEPGCVEEHEDSSDFEEDLIAIVQSRTCVRNEARNQKPSYDIYPDHDRYPVKMSRNHSPWSSERAEKSRKNFAADVKTDVQPKVSMRHKVIPCLSSIFKRHERQTSPENQDRNDRSCSRCDRRRMRKLYKKNYAVQPVYAIEGTHATPAPFASESPKKHRKKQSHYHPASSSSESESPLSKERHKYKNRKKTDTKDRETYKNRYPRDQQMQYPSKDRKLPYQVFASPYQPSRQDMSPDSSRMLGQMPSSSSSFWDFVFDKFHRKYQTHRVEMPKPCQCSSASQTGCSPNSCKSRQPPAPAPVNQCSCKAGASSQATSSNLPPFSSTSSPCKVKVENKKVQCKCYSGPKSSNESLPPAGAPCGACQQGHEEITSALTQKYNGEILCIHNPPCILINGCLNLPPQKDQAQLSFWPVEVKKPNFYDKRKKGFKSKEQSCQYHGPYVDVQQCLQYKTEKNIQSICDHNPPCEVVHCCYRPKYDPQLRNSCVHVPMCAKFPQCAARGGLCEHRPRCPEIPACSRNYAVLTAQESAATQVKPKLCRHEPQCVLIPKCVGRALRSNVVPLGARCGHKPGCEMIPACCRHCRATVSVSSQNPNSCRLV